MSWGLGCRNTSVSSVNGMKRACSNVTEVRVVRSAGWRKSDAVTCDCAEWRTGRRGGGVGVSKDICQTARRYVHYRAGASVSTDRRTVGIDCVRCYSPDGVTCTQYYLVAETNVSRHHRHRDAALNTIANNTKTPTALASAAAAAAALAVTDSWTYAALTVHLPATISATPTEFVIAGQPLLALTSTTGWWDRFTAFHPLPPTTDFHTGGLPLQLIASSVGNPRDRANCRTRADPWHEQPQTSSGNDGASQWNSMSFNPTRRYSYVLAILIHCWKIRMYHSVLSNL